MVARRGTASRLKYQSSQPQNNYSREENSEQVVKAWNLNLVRQVTLFSLDFINKCLVLLQILPVGWCTCVAFPGRSLIAHLDLLSMLLTEV